MLGAGTNTVEIIIAARNTASAAFMKAKAQMKGLEGIGKKLTNSFTKVAKAGALIGGAAVIAGIVGSTKAFTDFEDAMANVRKTTGFTKEEIGVLGDSINKLALRIPVAQTELAGIAAIAGQLGIQGKENILSFTEDVAKMSTAFDMSAESAATAMAKMSNIYGIPIEQASALGSAINVLGNTTAAQESAIMDFSMSLGASAKMLGFSATEAVSMGASLISMGMDASASGTRLNSAFTQMGKKIGETAAFLNMTEAEFKAAFGADPMAMVIQITEKLAQIEDPLERTAAASELFGLIGAKAITGLGGNLEGLQTNLANAAAGFEENTSLTEEFAAKTDTLKAKFTLLKNSVTSLLISVGGEIAPTLTQVIDGFRDILPAIKEVVFEIGTGFREAFESIARQAGPALAPFIVKAKEAGEKISAGFDFKTLADDVGVFIGAALGPLIDAFGWLIDKLGPLWEMIGKGAEIFHNLANALKTEEGRLDDIRDATEKVTAAKQTLFEINDKLAQNTATLAEQLENAGGWTSNLANLEAEAAEKAEALAAARKAATEAIATHGAESDIAKAAIENVKIAEEGAKVATESFNLALGNATQAVIDSGVATEGLQEAQLNLKSTTSEAASAQSELQVAVSALETETEEAKQAPFDLGEAFEAFGTKVKAVFAELPLRVAEAIAGALEATAAGFEKIKLSGVADNFEAGAKDIRAKIDTIREGLEVAIPAAMGVSEEAVDSAVKTIVDNFQEVKEESTDTGKSLEVLGDAAKDAFDTITPETEEATEKMEEFSVSIGDTTVSFKGAAAEVVKNADAYEKLQDSAQKIMDLDWSVFTEFEASLPSIETGIQDMEGAFVGLRDVLEDNIGSLENVQESVMDISEIAAPFLEKGFSSSVEAIGNFASTLKAAGSAINDFSSLQDVSIDGCINFSLHVRDMVSALEILEDQMEDLVPDFADMDSLITNILESFVWTPGKKESIADEINRIALAAKDGTGTIGELWTILEETTKVTETGWTGEFALPFVERYKEGVEDIEDITADFLASGEVLERQMGYTTDALSFQTGQLNKITEALQPYLEFMRTLNELAALSTLSTEELNNGLNAINETLQNLGKSLETFDLRPVMETLFGTKIAAGEFTGGIATGFTDTMKDFATPFSNLIVYVERLSSSIFSLVSSFEALAKISDSVLADQTKLKEVFEGITDVMTNFSTEMGGTEGFAQKFADGMDAMLKSAAPLIKYFQDNNAAVELFNKSLSSFMDTTTNVIGVFEDLTSVVKRSSELVVISAKEIETALSLVDDQLKEIALYLGSSAWSEIVTQLSAVSKEWEKWAGDVDNSMPAFNSAVDTFSTLISKILGLSSALKDMRDMTVLSVRDIDEALKNIPIFLDRFVDALSLNMGEIKRTLKDLDREWELHTDEMKDTMPAYEDSTDKVSKLIGSLLSLSSALKQLAEMGTISSKTFDTGFLSLIKSVSNFAGSLSKNVNSLIGSLQSLRTVWIDNEAVLFPLIRDFAVITDNLWGVAHNANRMADEFNELRKNSIRLERGFSSLIRFIDKVVEGTKNFYSIEAANEIIRFLRDIGGVINAFETLNREINDAMSAVKNAVTRAVNNIERKISSLDNLVRDAFYWGQNMMIGFINGIYSMEEHLKLAAIRMAAIVAWYLGASSNTEKGPLSHLESWGPNIVRTISEGLRSEMPTLNAAFGSMSSSMGAGTASGRGGNITLYNTQYINSREDGDYATQSLERMLQRHSVM
jgi:TP901 family phage tail tape measure protein